MKKQYYSVKGFEHNKFEELTREINLFIYHQLYEGQLIDIKYNMTPLSISKGTESGAHSNIYYTALVIYKK